MDPVSNVSQLFETLRKQLHEAQNKPGSASKASGTSKETAIHTRPSIEQMQRKVRDKLRHVDPDDPKAQAKSVRIFLESVLLWEFGENLMDDPKFYAVLDDVQLTMESDLRIKENLDSLISMLR